MIAEEIRSTSTTPSLNPNREIGLGFLNDFVPKTRNRHYARDRNYELGPGNHLSVSRLSAWLRCRLVTEEEVIRTVIGEHGYASADKFVQEVFWRIYFKGWLEQHPATWAGYRAELNRQSSLLRLDDRLEAQYTKATLARTGIECFDSWVRELKNTGYLHNHATEPGCQSSQTLRSPALPDPVCSPPSAPRAS